MNEIENKEELIEDINNLKVFIILDVDKEKGFDETVFIKRCLVDLYNTEYPPEVLDVKKFRCKNMFADMFIVRL